MPRLANPADELAAQMAATRFAAECALGALFAALPAGIAKDYAKACRERSRTVHALGAGASLATAARSSEVVGEMLDRAMETAGSALKGRR